MPKHAATMVIMIGRSRSRLLRNFVWPATAFSIAALTGWPFRKLLKKGAWHAFSAFAPWQYWQSYRSLAWPRFRPWLRARLKSRAEGRMYTNGDPEHNWNRR